MKIRNPYYVDPVTMEANALEAKVRAHLESKPGRGFIGMAKLKAAVPELATASRAAINVVCARLGAEIDEGGADDA